ncbi:unnamed protein product [Fusarium fujikuroi]|nr:unnamed protein product [Fusarium fujikuroi]
MPLYIYNISAATCFYLAILYLNTYKDISIKAKPAFYILLNKYLNNPISNILVAFTGITSISYPS